MDTFLNVGNDNAIANGLNTNNNMRNVLKSDELLKTVKKGSKSTKFLYFSGG